jgi:flavodoxin
MHSNTYYRSTGNTKCVASRIAAKIGADKCEDIGSIEPSALVEYDTLVVGAPTW